MKYLDEFRDPEAAKALIAALHAETKSHWVIMEICGGQTHAILEHGIDELLPKNIELVHGPGCPVCVTPLEMIDKALAIAARDDVIFTSFGDMLRVPGSNESLQTLRSRGADIRLIYSPLEALALARENPAKQVVFFAIGFETTAPGNAMAVRQAAKEGLDNFSVLVSHVLVPPALGAILADPANRVQGLIAAGHVCTVMGYADYESLAETYQMPIVPAGFEPTDLLDAMLEIVRQLERGESKVVNRYARAVRREGNVAARAVIEEVFKVVDRPWRGIGVIPASGWSLRDEYAHFDAEKRFVVEHIGGTEPEVCIAGLVLQGRAKPNECPAFGGPCSPDNPLGAPMVSSEGACSAYYRYHGPEKAAGVAS